MRKKKWLAILVAVAMVCTMLPMTAFAADETYQVWVGGVQVTSENAADVLEDGGTVIYNPSTSTLTLNNANITGGYEENDYFYGIRADGALNIVLTGSNTVTATAGTNCTFCYGIWVHDELNVSGDGTLTVTASEAASANTGITAFDVTINGSTVEATGGEAKNTSTGINSSQSINITGNSHVTATGIGTAMNASRGIKAKYDVTFNSGSVVDATGGLYGIDAGSNITLKAGSSGTAKATATSSSTATAMNKFPKRDSGLITAGAYNEQTMRWGEAAVDKYSLWIKGIQVTTLNQNDVLDDGKVKYDPATSTLTLNGAIISGSHKGGISASAAIYAKGSLTINLPDGSTNTVAYNGAANSQAHGIFVERGDLTIDGAGSLETTGIRSGICANNGNITINNGTVIAKGSRGDTSSTGIASYVKGITIKGGKVTAQGGDSADSNGIFAKVSVTIEDGEVNAHGGTTNNSSRGIVSNGTISFSGGKVNATGVTMGIEASSTITISGGTGHATASTAMNQAPVIGTGMAATGVYTDKTMTWEPAPTTYTVTYNGNGATGGTVPVDSNSPYEENGTVTVMDQGGLQKADHLFVGWNTQQDGKGTDYAAGTTFAITADTTLYAKWEPIIYNYPHGQTVDAGESVTFIVTPAGAGPFSYQWQVSTDDGSTWTNMPGKTNDFLNFQATEAMNGYQYRCTVTNTASGCVATSPAATLTVNPAPTTYTVTYNGNYNTDGAVPEDNNSYVSGATVTVLGNTGNLAKTDASDSYTFVGWNTLSNGFGTNYKTGDIFPITKDTTLYAKWARNPKITGGTVSVSANVGAPATINVIASGTGLTYQWQVSTDGGNTWNNVSDGTGATSAEYKTVATTTAMNGYQYRCIIKSAAGGVATSTAVTLTVNPAPITYTVTFNSKGGSAVASQTVNAGGKATVPTEPTKTGHTFAGWFKDESFTTVWDFDTDTVTAAVTLYGKWTAIAHTHDWDEPTYAWSAENTACTATRICKTDSSHVESANAVVMSSQTKAPTCTEKGETTYTATFDVDWTEQQTKMADIPMVKHSYQDGKCIICGVADSNYVPTEPTPTPDPTDTPNPTPTYNPNTETTKTGDNSNMMLWGMLLLAVGAGIAGVVLYGRKRAAKH